MSGFSKPNYTQTPNELFDVLMADMKECELKVTLAVIRATLGWHKKQAELSITYLMARTGLGRDAVIAGCKEGVKRGTLQKIERDGKTTIWELVVNDQSEFPTSNQSEIPTDLKKSFKEKDSRAPSGAPDKPKKNARKLQNSVPALSSLEGVFADVRKVDPPNWAGDAAAAMKTWRFPIDEILTKCDGREEVAAHLIKVTVERMIKDGLTFTKPVQIVETASSILANWRAQREARQSSPETSDGEEYVNFTRQRLQLEQTRGGDGN